MIQSCCPLYRMWPSSSSLINQSCATSICVPWLKVERGCEVKLLYFPPPVLSLFLHSSSSQHFESSSLLFCCQSLNRLFSLFVFPFPLIYSFFSWRLRLPISPVQNHIPAFKWESISQFVKVTLVLSLTLFIYSLTQSHIHTNKVTCVVICLL